MYRLPLGANPGETQLLTSSLTGPNGIAFSPDETKLYVTDTGLGEGYPPSLVEFTVKEDGSLVTPGKIIFDMSEDKKSEPIAVPDGVKVDKDGIIYCTGPAGVYILAQDGTHLGTIQNGQATSNVAFGGPDGTYLYMTGNMFLFRVALY